MNRLFLLTAALMTLVLTGCAKPVSYDYTAFKESKPKSILVLPPVNHSPDINASHSVSSVVTMPLAEDGYYVFPVAVVDETFKQNGMTSPEDIRAVSVTKLRQIFGADAALYIDVTDYGSSYKVISSEARVTANAKLIDLRNGKVLWTGNATASSNEQRSNNNGIIGMLVQAAVDQVANTLNDKSHDVAAVTSSRLLSSGTANGLLYGPRSANYGKEVTR
ncbi:DUF799 domain-containing protein [Hafnia psychrotolerans]|jgi:hypothetical protein|uniref:Lipoprotein n=1 Tax=Hafnia psychrotolerans TaxID=1477018 RepID=A0ABQ1FUX4_9GAMM|nr:DUF799 domain-containing protein [Hafnia psychrotolerans]GGA29901.1 lipoprotein [Hafnia psychrotolerans]